MITTESWSIQKHVNEYSEKWWRQNVGTTHSQRLFHQHCHRHLRYFYSKSNSFEWKFTNGSLASQMWNDRSPIAGGQCGPSRRPLTDWAGSRLSRTSVPISTKNSPGSTSATDSIEFSLTPLHRNTEKIILKLCKYITGTQRDDLWEITWLLISQANYCFHKAIYDIYMYIRFWWQLIYTHLYAKHRVILWTILPRTGVI